MKDIVKLAIDGHRGSVEKYSVKESQDALREALIEANNGKTTLNYKDIRDGKCTGIFSLIEDVLSATIVDGLQDDMYFNTLVDFRNVAEGDSPVFISDSGELFFVNDTADGTQGIRRQRLGISGEVTIPTSLKVVRIYEELNRVLAGRVDFNTLVDRVSDSFRRKLLDDVYGLWSSVTAEQLGGSVYFPVAGAFDEDALLDVVSHVEAAAGGKTATIIGTKKGLRKIKESVVSDGAKDELHNLGYIGKFYGTPVVATPQRHKVGSTEFALDDNVISVIATDEKPVKVVYEGDPIVIMGDPTTNADFTQEYLYGEKYGVGLVLANNTGIGCYKLA